MKTVIPLLSSYNTIKTGFFIFYTSNLHTCKENGKTIKKKMSKRKSEKPLFACSMQFKILYLYE